MRSKSLMLAVAAALSVTAVAAAATAPRTPAWVTESNQDAQILLKTFADFAPEQAGQLGVDGLDTQATNLTPDYVQRFDAAADQDIAQYNALLAKTSDPKVKQDLQILIGAVADAKVDNDLQQKYRKSVV